MTVAVGAPSLLARAKQALEEQDRELAAEAERKAQQHRALRLERIRDLLEMDLGVKVAVHFEPVEVEGLGFTLAGDDSRSVFDSRLTPLVRCDACNRWNGNGFPIYDLASLAAFLQADRQLPRHCSNCDAGLTWPTL